MGLWEAQRKAYRRSFRQSFDEAYMKTISLCPECKAITVKPSVEPQLLREYANNQALYDSTLQYGCSICRFILRRNIAQNRVQFEAEDDLISQTNVNAAIKVFQIFENGQYNLKWEADASVHRPDCSFGTYYSETFGGLVVDKDSPLRNTITGRKVDSKAQSRQNLEQARSWLNKCLQTHQLCKTDQPLLPTRVIDVGSSNRRTKLLITDRQLKGPYIALSYSWGQSPNLRLTADTLIQFSQQSIPFRRMPKSVQDAVTLTRLLGIRYLWVDALCIIQDSTSDWTKEAAVMGDIYSEATMVLKAASSADCQDGLYKAREDDSVAVFRLKVESEDGSQGYASLRLKSLIVQEPLDKRGWCLQESWLARRMLVFGSRQIWWECRTCTLTESGSPLLDGKLGPAPFPKPVRGVYGSSDVSGDVNESKKRDRYTWEDVVEGLSSRTFTYADDNLSALSGIAKLFSQTDFAGDTYIAGLWKSELPRNLLWEILYHRDAVQDRPRKRHAPSWSWASLSNGTILWPKTEEHSLDPTCASVVSYGIKPGVHDNFGKVDASGFIELSTQLKSAWRFWSEGGHNLAGWMLTADKPALPRPQVNLLTNYQATYDGTIGQCMLDWRDVDESDDESYMLYCVRITTRRGLLLEDVGEEGRFRRRGTFQLWGDIAEEWWSDCKKESITII